MPENPTAPAGMAPVLRRAHLREIDPVTVYLLAKLRQDVFTLEQGATDADLDGRELEDGTLLLWLEQPQEDGPARPFAQLRLLDGPGDVVRIGRVLVESTARRGGHGRRLMLAAIETARELYPGRTIALDAQAYLRDWYASMGFVSVGGLFWEAGIEHVAMELAPV